MSDILSRLRESAAAGALVGFGICDVEPFVEVATEMDRRRASGEAGRLRFTYADAGVATNVRQSFPWATRLVVGAASYLPASGNPGPAIANQGRVARFATSDHYQPLRHELGAIRELLRSAGHHAEVLVDDNRLVDRAAAIRAGIAWWGKSTMALTPKYGPWTLIGSVATDADLPTTSPMIRDCGTCVACIPACPTGALDHPGTLDATLCISYWAQMPGDIPLPIRKAWGDRLYGCDACLDACPPGERWSAQASDATGRADLLDFLTQTDSELRSSYGHFYIPRNDVDFLRRNALVALGHCGGPEAPPIIIRYLGKSRTMLRLHAAWALGQIGGQQAVLSLQSAIARENDSKVLTELHAALDAIEKRGPRNAPRARPCPARVGGYSVSDGGNGGL